MMSEVSLTSSTLPLAFRRAARTSGLAGAVALAATIVLWIVAIAMHRRWPDGAAAFYKGYLFAWLFFLSMSLGAMMAVMVHHLVGGEWGYFVQRFGEAAANVLPLLF
ncbi:MAG TPA: hypothetical protein VFC46_01695, partial [Humisphaera sp.]|nr:hypothetical protein [Humisphaera sp.]